MGSASKLVDYSDSSDDGGEEKPTSKRRKVNTATHDSSEIVVPPLPPTFRDLYSSTVRTGASDDATLHEGRKRVVPHVEGNWPTHVYLEWQPQADELTLLSDLVAHETKAISECPRSRVVHSLLQTELGVVVPLHVSLSRTMMLKAHQKDEYLTQFRQLIKKSAIHAFTVSVRDIKWYQNEIRSRCFLVLRLDRPPGSELSMLLSCCNDVARDFNQPLLYQDHPATSENRAEVDKFHVSIAWMLDDASPATAIATSNWKGELTISFGEVKVRCGQDVIRVPLTPRRSQSLNADRKEP